MYDRLVTAPQAVPTNLLVDAFAEFEPDPSQPDLVKTLCARPPEPPIVAFFTSLPPESTDFVLRSVFAVDNAPLLHALLAASPHVSSHRINEAVVVDVIRAKAMRCANVLFPRLPPSPMLPYGTVVAMPREAFVALPPRLCFVSDARTGDTVLHSRFDLWSDLWERPETKSLFFAANVRGETALFAMCRAGVLEGVVKLWDEDAAVLVRNVDGETCLDVFPRQKRDAMWESYKALLEERLGSADGSGHIRLQFVSDLHIEFERDDVVVESLLVKKPGCTHLALLGDIGLCSKPSYKTFLLCCAEQFEGVFVVLGNHFWYRCDYALGLREVEQICNSHDRLHLMYRRSLVVGDVRFVGATLWTHVPLSAAYVTTRSMNDFRQISNGHGLQIAQMMPDWEDDASIDTSADNAALQEYLSLVDPNNQEMVALRDFLLSDKAKKGALTVAHTNAIHAHDVAFIDRECTAAAAAGQRVVVLTHHGPLFHLGGSPANTWFSPLHHAFHTDLSQLLMKHSCLRHWLYGHTHWAQDLTLGRDDGTTCRVQSNPKGYATEQLPFSYLRHVDL